MINFDNPVLNAINKVVYMAYASVLWVLFSLPVFTIGASSAALYYSVHKVIKKDTGTMFATFWHGFKSNFKQATITWMFCIIIVIIGIADYFVLRTYFEGRLIFKVFTAVTVLIETIVLFSANYVFAYIARFQNSTKQILLNSVYFAVTNIWRSVILAALLGITVVLTLLHLAFFALTPGLYMFCAGYLIEPVFRKYMTPEDAEAERMRSEACNEL